MEINKIIKLLILCFFVQAVVSCKQQVKNDNSFTTDTLAIKVETEKTELNNDNKNDKDKIINFIIDFYTSYLIDFNNSTNTCDINKYLSKDFSKYLGSLDYDGIIHAQDYDKFDLNTLKASKTSKNNVYKVEFINMGHETVLYVKVKLINKNYKITNIAKDSNQIADIILSEIKQNEYDFDFLKYNTNPDDPHFSIIYTLEDFDSDTAIFQKVSNDESFEYFCLKKNTKKGLELYYEEDSKYNTYTGDTSKSLITIYKKGDDFYAKSPLIEGGKEIKLKERGF
ncbi:hypothetical protein ACFSTE_20420 [Aquimarina hainanensis]|uniref:DUF3828 domain-containing protein n=1 Tax=Aquimarina hainanensis TaxID=1578017 RepID=A0ABW5ND88_9FLAO